MLKMLMIQHLSAIVLRCFRIDWPGTATFFNWKCAQSNMIVCESSLSMKQKTFMQHSKHFSIGPSTFSCVKFCDPNQRRRKHSKSGGHMHSRGTFTCKKGQLCNLI